MSQHELINFTDGPPKLIKKIVMVQYKPVEFTAIPPKLIKKPNAVLPQKTIIDTSTDDDLEAFDRGPCEECETALKNYIKVHSEEKAPVSDSKSEEVGCILV